MWKIPHCLARKVLETGSLPPLRKVPETGGEATVSLSAGTEGDADGPTMNEKQALTKQLAFEYKRATKKNKGRILDSLARLAEYNRSYAARVLRHRVTANVLASGTVAGVQITVVEDERTRCRKKPRRPRKYGKDVLVPLQKIRMICDGICGKRLGPYLAEIMNRPGIAGDRIP